MASPTPSSDGPAPHSSSEPSSNIPTPPSSPPDEFDTAPSSSPPDKFDRDSSLSFQSSLGCSEAEPVEDYRPGGFHPVHFGDLLHHGQYKIVRKLGFGAFSTAWLAKDTLNSQYVAVKIKTAETSEDNSELSILSYLSQQRNSDWMSRHVITLLDCFQHQGPNGKHICIVSEALSASVSSVLNDTFEYSHDLISLFPKWMAKRILRQILFGLCFLHSHGVIHGDIHLNNILFEVPNLASYTVKELEHDKSKDVQLVARPDGTPDQCVPRYLPVAWPLIEHSCNGPGFTVKITDLGGSFLSADTSKNPDTPRSLRAPERLFDCPLDQTVDIWSFGCLVYELLTGYELFLVMPGQHDDAHILQIIDQLGPLPERLFSQWGQSHKYYRPNGEHFNSVISGPRIGLYESDSFATSFHKRKGCEIDDKEEESVIDMLRKILRYEQEKRPCAKELLSHPWFADNGSF